MGPMTLHHLRCCHVLCYEKANLLLTLLINPKYQTIYAYSYLSKAIKSFNYEGMMNLMKDIDFLTGKFFQTYLWMGMSWLSKIIKQGYYISRIN